MGKKLNDEGERVIQRTIGFKKRQIDFFADHPEFKPDKFCRDAVDEQIRLHSDGTKYLKKEQNETQTN